MRFTISWDLPRLSRFVDELKWDVEDYDDVLEILSSCDEKELTEMFGYPEVNIED